MLQLLAILALFVCWVGHACIWTATLNNLYGRPWPKLLLRLYRLFTALVLIAFPVLLIAKWQAGLFESVRHWNSAIDHWDEAILAYSVVCLFFGAVVFPIITIARALRKPPTCILDSKTQTLDLWPELGTRLIGDHKFAALTRLPANGVFRVDITDLTIALPSAPRQWDGLVILAISDLHFHGTPSRAYFDRIVEELLAGPQADLICALGDYVDSHTHRDWIQPILGRLQARDAKLAILGNHDLLKSPDKVRDELVAAGYDVLGNEWRAIEVRGVRCLAIGHEGPWFAPEPDLSGAPSETFKLCLSHTPDNFYWGQAHGVGLMLCGHVHGGAIRIPLVGPIFVPSVFGRRFDSGVFEKNGLVMVVNRGLSGKEPIRFRCNPQVIRITLKVSEGGTTSG